MRRLPFLLAPAAKDYIWGGSRLNDDFNLGLACEPLAEAWVCSTHPDGQSMVYGADFLTDCKTCGTHPDGQGIADGVPLRDVLTAHPEWLGTHPLQVMGGRPELPILIKLIDAKADLSVQVHPDDAYALMHEGSLGKTEMWYVLSARKGSKLVYGFRQDMDADSVREAIEAGRIGRFLNHVPVEKDDMFYIEAGTVHALGAGCLLAEIQESSNLTYRLYDYGREDKDGRMRPLHIDKALEVASLKFSAVPRQPMRMLRYKNGFASEFLCRCRYFQVERMLLNTEIRRGLVAYRTGSNSFHALLCVDGCGSICAADAEGRESFMLNFFKGDCIFVPADCALLKLHGKAQLLDVGC